jgi:hypothetical protein
MIRRLTIIAATALCVALSPAPAAAQEMSEAEYLAALEAELPGTLMNNPVSPQWDIYGQDFTKRVVEDKTVTGAQAVRIKVKTGKPNPWDISMTVRMDKGVAAGDAILVAAWVRTEKPAKGRQDAEVQVRLQQAASPYSGLAEGVIRPGSDWQLWYVRGRAAEDFEASEINLAFNVGGDAHTIDIAQFYVMNLGQGVDVETLPTGPAP